MYYLKQHGHISQYICGFIATSLKEGGHQRWMHYANRKVCYIGIFKQEAEIQALMADRTSSPRGQKYVVYASVMSGCKC